MRRRITDQAKVYHRPSQGLSPTKPTSIDHQPEVYQPPTQGPSTTNPRSINHQAEVYHTTLSTWSDGVLVVVEGPL